MKSATRLFVLAFSLLLVGYFGIKLFYDEVLGLPGTGDRTLTLGLIVMTIFAFCTGAGGNAVSLAILLCICKVINYLWMSGYSGGIECNCEEFS